MVADLLLRTVNKLKLTLGAKLSDRHIRANERPHFENGRVL